MAEQLTKLCVEHSVTCVSFHVIGRLGRQVRGAAIVRDPTVTATEATLPH